MGYTSVNANLLTVPVYFWGLIWFLFVAYMSDRQTRGKLSTPMMPLLRYTDKGIQVIGLEVRSYV